jgi:very-short-patch-repair endonuclease
MREVYVDLQVARVAAQQRGLITTRQLFDCGLDKSAIGRRLRVGRLHRVHRGVYSVGHAGLLLGAKWKAATLYCGEGSALSHRSGTELWRMLEHGQGPIHVSVRTPGGRSPQPGLAIHRIPSLQAHDVTVHHGIPVTTPQRTLLDIRNDLDPGELRRAVRQAEILRLPVDAGAIIGDRATSELELRFLDLCRRHRLPPPEVNVVIEGIRVDFLWRRERLIVETDGRAFHRGVVSQLDDRDRDQRLASLGYETFRLTWHQVVHERAATAALIRSRLRERATQSSR